MKISKKDWPLSSVYGIRQRINTNPDFQRPAVWGLAQKQLLIDTILRDYDVPKLYWRKTGSKPDTYDVVDGQQRLRTIWAFFNNEFKLPKDATIVMYTGHLYDWKGADLLLEAADKLGEDYLVILVGAHPHELVKIKERYPETRAMILPFLRRENIPFYLKAADILVIPNKAGNPISEKYTSPLKLFGSTLKIFYSLVFYS